MRRRALDSFLKKVSEISIYKNSFQKGLKCKIVIAFPCIYERVCFGDYSKYLDIGME
jgi:hypothetical protein